MFKKVQGLIACTSKEGARVMNGLEAIKVMMKGKLVSKFNSCMEDEIYKIIDGNVCVKFEDEP